VGTFGPQDHLRTLRPGHQIQHAGDLHHPGTIPEATLGVDRRLPTMVGNLIDNEPFRVTVCCAG
jgi:hypothetical protein